MSNKPQNIFDNPEFFKGYRELRERDDNMNVLLEQPEIKKLLPDLKGKSILDLGCGYGGNCAEFVRAGAKRVVGVDLSEKMLEVAKSENCDGKIEFLRMDMTDVDRIDGEFDLIFSSLAFHYVEDFVSFAKKLYGKLSDGGTLLFSQEHPLNTAGDGVFNLDEEDNAVSYDLKDYARPGIRRVDWFVNGIEKYHRTFAGILNPLIEAGFIIEKIIEPTPTEEALSIRPKLIRQFIRPCFVIISARKKRN